MNGYVAQRRGRFYAVIYEGRDPVTGKERRTWHPAGTDRTEAEALVARLAAERDGRNDEVRSLTFGAYLTHQWLPSEKAVFGAVAGLGIDTVETVLLYHVVPGATITKAMAVKSNGAQLTTALGSTIGVRVFDARYPIVMLKDQDPDDINPFLNPRALDINKGNKQIAHGILFVLRPANL